MHSTTKNQKYVVCIRNDDCDDIEIFKIYCVIRDGNAKEEGMLRLIDESGEDYLYPKDYFTTIKLPKKAIEVFGREHVGSVA